MKLSVPVHLLPLMTTCQATYLGAVESLKSVAADGGVMCRALCGRRKENKKEELPEDQTSPYSQMLQKGQGAQTTDDKTKETGGDKAAEEGPPPGKTEPRKDAKSKASSGLQARPILVHLQASFRFGKWGSGPGGFWGKGGADVMGHSEQGGKLGCKTQVCRATTLHDLTSGSKTLISILR